MSGGKGAGRFLAVDLGTRRVGLAMSDPAGMIASPFDTLPFVSLQTLADRIRSLCGEKDVDLVVVGFPVRDDGREGEGCERSRAFARMLHTRGIPCRLWDESWSSREAEKVLREAGKTRRKSKEKVDAIAASVFLRDFMDSTARGAD
jgi:putative Holliday junction resolvase